MQVGLQHHKCVLFLSTGLDGSGYRLSDSILGMGVVIKEEKDWRGVGRFQVAMHSQLPRFLVAYFFKMWLPCEDILHILCWTEFYAIFRLFCLDLVAENYAPVLLLR